MNDRGREWVREEEEKEMDRNSTYSQELGRNLKKVYDLLLNLIK